jgi:cytochrome c peroxidase
MTFTHELAVDALRSIPQYRTRFQQLFGVDKIDIDIGIVAATIAAFEETLVTPDSRFDKWLKGDKQALNQTELDGYKLFKESGCTSCHNGATVGGSSFQKFGIYEVYKTANKVEGRSAVTGRHADRFKFKVPNFRSVELTYPYFHDVAAETWKTRWTTWVGYSWVASSPRKKMPGSWRS